MNQRFILACGVGTLLLAGASQASAQGLLPADDWLLRADVTLLVDEGVLNVPTTAWPIPAADLRRVAHAVKASDLHSLALQSALTRLQGRLGAGADDGSWRLEQWSITAGEPPALRDYSTLSRGNIEAGVAGAAFTERWTARLAVAGALSPDDNRSLRFDGTELSLRLGNWLFSANQLGRWWGPGWRGSLIMSTNAPPMPALSLDRVLSTPFAFPVLRLLGPWRFTTFVGAQEGSRLDVDRSLFMAARVSFKPAPILEFGLSRTAQFCGEGRPCGAGTFWNVFTGRDNEGIRVSPEDEPGNQMAGFDARIVSPWRSLPLAVYGQMIGEDGSSSGIPSRYLGLFGAEMWWATEDGSRLRARLEYADTTCKFYSPNENPDCSYRQNIFFAGYRYRGRNIGHTTDADSESLAASVEYVRAAGDAWVLQGVWASLDRYGPPNVFNPLTSGPGKYHGAQLAWQGQRWGEDLAVQLGYERFAAGGRPVSSGPYGFVRWRRLLDRRD